MSTSVQRIERRRIQNRAGMSVREASRRLSAMQQDGSWYGKRIRNRKSVRWDASGNPIVFLYVDQG